MPSKFFLLLGEVLLTMAALAALYLIYSYSFTNQISEISKAQLTEAFVVASESQSTKPQSITSDSNDEQSTPSVNAFGLVYIPALKSDVWEEPLVRGIDRESLFLGIAHYPTTEGPGEVGNFAIAGHRSSHGQPFARFENLRKGDSVFIRTKDSVFEYRLIRDQIVGPEDVWVLNDVPTDDFKIGSSLITLTTCHPFWSSEQRWVWWGELVGESQSLAFLEEVN